MPADLASATGGELRAARLALGLSQEQLARRLGVSFATVNRWERGRTRPGKATRSGVAAVLTLADRSLLPGRERGESERFAALPAAERRLLERLAVFPASFSLEAAEAVGGLGEDGSTSTLVMLGSLLTAGLVALRMTASGIRYELPDAVRAAGVRRLAESGGAADAARRHVAWCLRFVAQAEPGMRGPEQAHWLATAAFEAESVAAGIESAAAAGDAAATVELAGGFWRYWYSTSKTAEGRRLLALALSVKGRVSDSARAKALLGSGVIARHHGDLPAAIRFFHEHLALARLGADDRAIAQAHNSLAGALHQSGQFRRARELLLASLDWWEHIRDRQGMAAALSNLGIVASDQGELEAAREFGEQALAIRLAIGNSEAIAISCENLATVALRAGDAPEARRLFREALLRYAALDELDGVAAALDGLVLLLDDAVAAPLLRLADGIRERVDVARSGDLADRIATRRAGLSSTDEGDELEIGAGVELALAASAADDAELAAGRLRQRLSPREREVLALVTAGSTSKEIAARLGRSRRTIEHHLANMYAKIGARGRADAIAFGLRMGLDR